MIAGFIAGLLAFGVARAYGEPQVDRAIAFDEQLNAAANEPAEPELVSRESQAGIGLFVGIMTYSVAMGGIFSLVFAFTYGRVSRVGPRGLSAIIGIAAFVTLILVPEIKYPANPPAASNPATIAVRSELFLVMIIASVVGTVVAVALAPNLLSRFATWNAWIIAGIAYLAFIVIVLKLLPSIDETPENFSAVNMWNFRVASIGIHAVVWSVLALVFGVLAERVLAKSGSYRGVPPAR
jgi:hypothetical protein